MKPDPAGNATDSGDATPRDHAAHPGGAQVRSRAASSGGATVCSQGRKPLEHARVPTIKPQRGDRPAAVTPLPSQPPGNDTRRTTVPPFAALRLTYLRRVVGTALAAAGIERATRWASWIARNLFDLNPPARKRIETNLFAAYGHTLSATGQERLARAVFDNIARFWIEALFARRLLKPTSWQRFIRVADPETWHRLAADPGPAILVTGYFGNVAVGAYALGRIFRPVHVLIDRFEVPVLRDWQDDLYRQRDVRLVPREHALTDLPRILDAGGKVMILGDHPRPTGRAIEVPFLGRIRRCYPTVGILAARHNARVVAFSTRRVPPPPFRFELRCDDVIAPDEPNRVAWACTHTRVGAESTTGQRTDPCHPISNDPVRAITERYMSALEHTIREAPEQYDWTRRS